MGWMLASYGDESGDKHVYAVSTLLGHLRDAVELERLWNRGLKRFGIEEFHASHLEKSRGEFRGWDRDRKDEVQRHFYGLAAQSGLFGYSAFLIKRAFEDRKKALQWIQPGGHDAHLFAWRMVVEQMVIDVQRLPKAAQGPIAFVFDQHQQHDDFIRKMHVVLRDHWAASDSIGSLSFDMARSHPALQASDAWGYEARKWVSDMAAGNPMRWQMKIFYEANRFNVVGYDGPTLDKMMKRAKKEQRTGRDLLKLPDDFLGNVQAFLNTPPPPKAPKKPRTAKKAKKR